MPIPKVVLPPPFNITRASHISLTVKDLAESKKFYTEILGLVISDEGDGVLYLRGVEEACHHSVILRQASGEPICEYVGMRVLSAADLDVAEKYVAGIGGTTKRMQRPYQGETMMVSFDPGSPPLELCVSMPVLPRMMTEYPLQKAGKALRFDHYQCVVPSVDRTAGHFMGLGFRPSKFVSHADTEELLAIFLHRKNNPHDIVLAKGAGPRLHHFAFVVSDMYAMLRAADTAAYYGYGRDVERGIGRHGPPNGVFLYFRDPDGHRIEFILPPMQFMDPEEVANTWDSNQGASIIPWGDDPSKRWKEEASPFPNYDSNSGAEGRWMPKI
jgi:catechol 2,3-dioxygenase